jgi:hypothetical protein
MKKTLALLLVASLLLAGCTELTDAVDEAGEEILNIEVNEDIALEKVEDFLTVDESESFGITVMYEIDMSQMDDGSGMLEVDEDAIMTMEMTEAWSPNGYHSSSVMGMNDGDMTISMITSMTHVGTTMYMSIGYEMDGELGSDASQEEQMMVDMMPEVEHFSMATTTTHTEVIAAMAAESQESSDDMDPMAFLEMVEMIEEYGTFTPAESVNALQLFDVAIDMAAVMEGEIPTPEEALAMCDADASGGISFEEFMSEDCDDTDSEDAQILESEFNYQDADGNGELSGDELSEFIGVVSTYYEQTDSDDDMEMDAMPAMQVAFTSTGDIEYFSMEMEGTEMMMYILTEDRVNALFTDLNAGETVALPFSLSFDMYDDDWDDDWGDDGDFYCNDGTTIPMDWVNDGDEDCADGEDEMDMGGSDDEFMCDDGDTIPMDWVNDGMADCAGGEDEFDSGDDSGDGDYIFYCSNDGEAYAEGMGGILCPEGPDVTPECPNGEDCVCIDVDGSCSDGDDDWGYLAADEDDSGDYSTIYDGCTESTDPADSYYECWMNDWLDSDGNILDSDGYEMDECTELADGSGWDCLRDVDSLIDDMVDEWMAFMDADGDGNISWDEHDTFIIGEDGWDSEDARNATMMIWSEYDSDLNGGLDEFELAGYLEYIMDELMAEEYGNGPTFICGNGEEIPFEYVNDGGADCADGADEQQYDSDGNEINWFDCMDGSQVWISQVNDGNGDCPDSEDEMPDMGDDDDMGGSDDEFMCDDGETIPMDWVNDGMDDCSGGEDEFDDYGGEDYSDEIVMYVTSEMDFHFEGDFSDYKIELATCESDYDMDTGEETMTCTTVMSVAIADAGEDSDIMFHDADSSGTLSVGDMIHIGETAESWDEVRLYSISADAYSDENPMHDAPGFTGLVGMLALLGAAFIRRNE